MDTDPNQPVEVEPSAQPPADRAEDQAVQSAVDHPAGAPAPKSNSISFKRSHLYALLLPLAFVTGLAAGYLLWGRTPPAAAPTTQADTSTSAAPSTDQKPVRYNVTDAGNPSLGPKDAPITIIEFSDYECPYCRQWEEQVFHQLLDAYPQKIRFVYRDFPLAGLHSNATSAAEAADCAGEQNKYWEFHEALFSSKYNLGSTAYLQYAQDMGLDTAKFSQCVSSRKYKDEVSADYNFAANLGVSSTPTFFINGLAVVGAQPLSVFKSIVDQELAGTIP